MEQGRKLGSGVFRVVLFNWHFYLCAIFFIGLAILLLQNGSGWLFMAGFTIVMIAVLSIVLSLSVTFYVYDLSCFYQLNWLNETLAEEPKKIINIHAGYDETSMLIANKYPNAQLLVFDFYDPAKHTELSIKRARKRYPPFPGTRMISTELIPLPTAEMDLVMLIFAAHEIRNNAERERFFRECYRILKPDGHIVVVEHLRDLPNAVAYNFGFYHFYSAATWLHTYKCADLTVQINKKINLFVNLYILNKNDNASSNSR